MKKPNLREQFEKETGNSPFIETDCGDYYSAQYAEWLETINSEMIDALVEVRELINEKYFIREGDSLVLAKIEQALKKAGVEV